MKLGGGDEVFIDGDGLFGCMLADPGWKDVAKGFMAKVEAQQAEEERAKAKGKGKKKKNKADDDESEPLSATLDEPSPLSKLTVRFEMYCDGEPVPDSKPSLVPGRYIARMIPDDPDDAFGESPFGDDDPVEDDGGEFSASVAARMPAIAIPAAIMQRMREGEDLRMEFMVQIAISGDDFIPGRLVSAFGTWERGCCTHVSCWLGLMRGRWWLRCYSCGGRGLLPSRGTCCWGHYGDAERLRLPGHAKPDGAPPYRESSEGVGTSMRWCWHGCAWARVPWCSPPRQRCCSLCARSSKTTARCRSSHPN